MVLAAATWLALNGCSEEPAYAGTNTSPTLQGGIGAPTMQAGAGGGARPATMGGSMAPIAGGTTSGGAGAPGTAGGNSGGGGMGASAGASGGSGQAGAAGGGIATNGGAGGRVATAGAAAMPAAGSGAAGGGSASGATFTTVFSQILSPKCAACHGTPPVDFSAKAAAYTSLVGADTASTCLGMKRVVAGDAAASILVQAIKAEGCRGVTGRMPPAGNALTSAEIDLVISWISAGAKND
jgi:hypothetical protein